MARNFGLSFVLISLISVSAFSQLDQKLCTGEIADLNCYAGVIKKQARELNQRDYEKAMVSIQINGTFVPAKKYFKGRHILLDTSDQESCWAIKQELENANLTAATTKDSLADLCHVDPHYPFETVKTITVMGEVEESYVQSYNNSFLTNTDKTLLSETRNLIITMAGTMGMMYLLPRSITKWTDGDNHWRENVSRPPVFDKDGAAVNYIGHPVSGAFYYTVARNLGLSKLQSFGYTVVMSTFFWEYGFEAIAERPSIQDLIITPIVGSLIGEYFFSLEQKILANGGTVNCSKTLGRFMLFILNPAGRISEAINRVLGYKMIQNSKFEIVTSRRRINPLQIGGPTTNYIGIQLRFNGNFL